MKSAVEKLKQLARPTMTMAEYMEFALYDSEFGYYIGTQPKIGKQGDFYTNSSISSVFGKVWAEVFSTWVGRLNLQPVILEVGGGNGAFAAHVLETIKISYPGLYKELNYLFLEESPYHRQLASERLIGKPVSIFSSFEELQRNFAAFPGIVFANELLDAFPVRVLKRYPGYYSEIGVTIENDQLTEKEIDFQDAMLIDWIDLYLKQRPIGWRFELPLEMSKWLIRLYHWMEEGALAIFTDYGYRDDEWEMPYLKQGSLRGYYKHQIIHNVLRDPGKMDITSHVPWDTVIRLGNSNGMGLEHFQAQGDFLLDHHVLSHLSNHNDSNPFSEANKLNRSIRSFLLDGQLARGFQVLVQTKRRLL